MTYSIVMLIVAGTLQLLGMAIVANIIANKVLRKRDIAIATLFMTIGGTLFLNSMQYFTIIYTVGVLFVFMKWRKAGWVISLVAPMLSFLLAVVVDYILSWVVGKVFGVYASDYDSSILGVTLTILVFLLPFFMCAYLLGLVIHRILYRQSTADVLTRNGFVVVILMLMTSIITYLLISAENVLGFPEQLLTVYPILFITFFLIICIVFLIINKIGQEREKMKKREMELAQLRDYTVRLEEMYVDMNMFRHDYINILASLHGYIEKADQELLEKYFNEVIVPLKNRNQIK
ncbi:hypothetical protein HCA60_12470 [Listeria booriae]|uniref:hypothetical protein n=1 Tax=Listeria booriae TaxID=1552123 RepID=UPI00162A835A|nr:hypothetical protein [Listeria booriae]MBC1813305.1 hypothetical protein [Listeria booriae]